MTIRTIGDWNAAVAAAPVTSAERLLGAAGLAVLSPHPDDETLGASALIQAAARLGRPVGIVALTDGEASHRKSDLFPPRRLAEVREKEQEEAVAALGCDRADFLRLRLPDGASGRDARFEAAAESVAGFLDGLGASALVAPHPDDPHPDHHAAAALALQVRALRPRIRLLFFEVWSRRLEPGEPFGGEDISPFRVPTDTDRKRAAIACHRSQLGQIVSDDPEGFVLPDWFLAAQDDPLERCGWYAMPGHVPDAEHFTRLYADDGDPWHVRSSEYEASKRSASIDALTGRRYASALEVGCGEGFLTRALIDAELAERALGIDREPTIVDRALCHPANPDGVSFAVGSAPDGLPDGPFDLVILSEVLYFLDERGLAALAAALRKKLTQNADLLVVSYLGATDTPLAGRDAADFFAASFGEAVRTADVRETPDYRIERLAFVRAPA